MLRDTKKTSNLPFAKNHSGRPPTCWAQSPDKMDLGGLPLFVFPRAKCQRCTVSWGVAQIKQLSSISLFGLWSPLMPCPHIKKKNLKGSGNLISPSRTAAVMQPSLLWLQGGLWVCMCFCTCELEHIFMWYRCACGCAPVHVSSCW